MKGEDIMSDNSNDKRIKKILENCSIPERLEPENIKRTLDNNYSQKKRSRIKKSRIMRIAAAAAALAVVFGTSVYFMKPSLYKDQIVINDTNKTAEAISMKSADNYSEVYNYFTAATKLTRFRNTLKGILNGGVKGYAGGGDIVYEDAMESESVVENGSTDDIDGSAKKDFSDTYNQEEGVLEADIVKTDGDRIFYANGDNIYIARADNGRFLDHSSMSVSGKLGISRMFGEIRDMYIYKGKLIAVCEYYNNNDGENSEYYDSCYGCGVQADTYTAVFNASNLELIGYYIQEGSYNDVRLMSDGYLYIISSDDKYLDYEETSDDDIDNYIPQYCVGNESRYVDPENIMIPSCKITELYDYVSYTNISGLDLNSEAPNQPVDMKSIAGYTNNVYCSPQNLYVVSGYDESEITRFSVSGGAVAPQASGKVNGYVNDQFSMSEYNGFFRIAVTENVWEESTVFAEEDSNIATNALVTQKNSLYVLDMDMKVVGSISDFGINEQIKSVNFSGDTAYAVTFRQTDPLYAIDLSNPYSPIMLDELKISGYSSYMQKWGDGLLLGFGAEADEDTGRETGIKVTMFDNSNPDELAALDSVSLISSGEFEYIYSEAVYERKALFIDAERNLIGFPVDKYNYDENGQSLYSYQFYSFENDSFTYKGSINKENGQDSENFRRAVYIDGYLYAVSSDEFKAADAVTITQTDYIQF